MSGWVLLWKRLYYLHINCFSCRGIVIYNMNLKNYKQVSSIYTTTDDSIFYRGKNRPLDDDNINRIQREILEGYPIFPLVVNNTPAGFEIKDGQHRLEAIRNLNKDRDEKIEIPFYINWRGRSLYNGNK